jgi:hypothetical protein
MYHSYRLDGNPITTLLNYYNIEHITSVQSNNNEVMFEFYEVRDLPSWVRSGGCRQPLFDKHILQLQRCPVGHD